MNFLDTFERECREGGNVVSAEEALAVCAYTRKLETVYRNLNVIGVLKGERWGAIDKMLETGPTDPNAEPTAG